MVRGGKPLNKKCSVKDCENKHVAKGYCMKHIKRSYRGNNPEIDIPVGRPLNPEKKQLLDDLYEVLRNAENEEVYNIIGRAIDFVKKG